VIDVCTYKVECVVVCEDVSVGEWLRRVYSAYIVDIRSTHQPTRTTMQAVKILEDDMACDIIKIGGIVRNKEVRDTHTYTGHSPLPHGRKHRHHQLTSFRSTRPIRQRHDSASSSGGSGWWGPTAPRSRRWSSSRYVVLTRPSPKKKAKGRKRFNQIRGGRRKEKGGVLID
jgi:hypothetical protein